MSIREVTYYEIACDHDGCTMTTASLNSDYSAWSDRDGAMEDWAIHDGVITSTGGTYCWRHDPEREVA